MIVLIPLLFIEGKIHCDLIGIFLQKVCYSVKVRAISTWLRSNSVVWNNYVLITEVYWVNASNFKIPGNDCYTICTIIIWALIGNKWR